MPRPRARKPLLLTFLLLVGCCLLAMPAPAPHAAAPRKTGGRYTVSSETFWISIYIQGRKAGFGRGKYDRGVEAPFSYENVIVVSLPQNTKVAERTTWEFDGQLKPASLVDKAVMWQNGRAVTNTVEGHFHYEKGKLSCDYHEWGAQEKVEIPIPSAQIARYTQNLILAHAHLKVGSRLKFQAYSIKDRRFVQQQIRVTGYDGGRNAFKLEATSEEAPAAVSTLWFQLASATHPNGFTLSSSMPGPQNQMIDSRATTREEAIQGFEKEVKALKL
jgi:hypothetical protein